VIEKITFSNRPDRHSYFEWDEGNSTKNWEKHAVSNEESEEVFTNEPFFYVEDAKHSEIEPRYNAFGRTNENRRLFITFTVRNGRIRVISARPMSKVEREGFDEYIKRNSKL
jgi:uncharacterized protein